MNRMSILFLAFTIVNVNYTEAQETISLNVVYEFRYVRDTAKRNNPYTETMVLSLGKRSSRYCSERLYLDSDRNAADQNLTQQGLNVSSKSLTSVAGGPVLIVNKYGAIINEEIIRNTADSSLTLYSVMGFKSYKVESKIPAIAWKLLEERKMIGMYACQKATGIYAGRTYEAWFTADLPYQQGPWKLSGLPGLILEAKDLKNEVSFAFKGLSKNTDVKETIKSYLNDGFNVKTTLKGYNRTKAAFETDPESVMAAMAPNAVLTVTNIDDPQGTGSAVKIKKYNPLELE